MKYLAIINVPGYMSEQDELPKFDTCSEAWEYLIEERKRDLDDPMSDEDDDVDDGALDEMYGRAEGEELGTVYGFTPGYDGDHDLGLAYTVMAQEVTLASGTKCDWTTEVNTFPMS